MVSGRTGNSALKTLQRLFFASLLLLGSARTYADTLFIDLNNAQSEIQALSHYGKVDVVPSYAKIPLAQRAAVAALHVQTEALLRQAERCGTAAQPDCAKLYATLRQHELRRQELTGHYGINDLRAEIGALQRARGAEQPYAHIVISGHHEHGYFDGEIFSVRSTDMQELIAGNKPLSFNARYVTLLGCNTGTPEMYRGMLQKMFPMAEMMVGAEDKAPTKNEARNVAFIHALAQTRARMSRIRFTDDALALYNNMLGRRWPVSMLWRGNWMFFKDAKISIDPKLAPAPVLASATPVAAAAVPTAPSPASASSATPIPIQPSTQPAPQSPASAMAAAAPNTTRPTLTPAQLARARRPIDVAPAALKSSTQIGSRASAAAPTTASTTARKARTPPARGGVGQAVTPVIKLPPRAPATVNTLAPAAP